MSEKIKVLNLYAGIGGNRKLWKNVDVAAVENNESIAAIYSSYYPTDEIIVCDALHYLVKHYDDFDFIWASPPCTSHSIVRKIGVPGKNSAILPDLSLYSLIIFLKHHVIGKWVVENVVPYYDPLITPNIIIGRHCFWSNFNILPFTPRVARVPHEYMHSASTVYGFNLQQFKVHNYDKRRVLRNLVDPYIARHIFECAFTEKQKQLINF